MASSSLDAASLPLPLAMAIVDRSVTIRGSPSPKRPPPRAQPLSDKAQQRLMRQAVIQAELEAEEREALKMTAEEYKILHDSVASVKAEFPDLDGLSWDTPAARELLEQWHAEQAARHRAPSPDEAAGVPLRRTKAASALTFPKSPVIDITPVPSPAADTSDEDTIRVPRYMDSRRSSGASTIVPDVEDQRTPLPSLFSFAEKENDGQAPPVFRHMDEAVQENGSPPNGIGGIRMRRSKATCGLSIRQAPSTDATPVPSPTVGTSSHGPPGLHSGNNSTSSAAVKRGQQRQVPLPSLLASLADKENGPDSTLAKYPGLPKSRSAPEVSLTNPFTDDVELDRSVIAEGSSGPSRRATKALPPSRIPILRSKSLSAKPSTTTFTFTAPMSAMSASSKEGPDRRAVSLNAKRVDPRAILTDSIRRNGPRQQQQHQRQQVVPVSPAKRSVAVAGLSASPRRLPGLMSSPRRVSDGQKSKFRIISAPPQVTIPTRPASTPRNVSGPTRVTAVSNSYRPATPERHPRQAAPRDHHSPSRPASIRPRAVSDRPAPSPAPAPHGFPLLTGKRARDRRDEGSPSASPARARACAPPGGFPMKRT